MRQDDVLISVLMPAFNVENYISSAIESILSQSYQNLELIIVDDGSVDNTLKTALGYSVKDPRIKILSNGENKNIVYSLNRAFEASRGEYILRMDADDLCDKNRLMNLFLFLTSNTKYELVGSSLISIDCSDNEIGSAKYFEDESFLIDNLKLTTPVSHIWLAKRQLYIDLNGYRDIAGAEDYDFLLRMVTMKRHFTNIEDDFSYKVRIGRDGNTASLIGVKQLKLKKYAYNLYQERVAFGNDSFSLVSLTKAVYSNRITCKIHLISNYCLLNGIKLWSKKRYLLSLTNVFCSLISPYQCSYLFNRLILKIKIRYKT